MSTKEPEVAAIRPSFAGIIQPGSRVERAMGLWKVLRCEPSLDDLLADEMMGAVTRSAGTDRAGLRAMLSALALRLPAEQLDGLRPRCASPAASGCRPAAG
jgi:hypothetical protein